MVVTSFVCILLTVCEIFYLCGKKCWELSGGGHRVVRDRSVIMTPLNGKDNSVFKEPGLEKMKMVDGQGCAAKNEISAPAYSLVIS